jgi:hypothetical protein
LELGQWVLVLEKFDDILSIWGNKIPLSDSTTLTFVFDDSANLIVSRILEFLLKLFKVCYGKCHFQSYEVYIK